MPDSAPGGERPTVDWPSLLEAVAAQEIRVVLSTDSACRVVLISERELGELEAAAARAQAPRIKLTPRERQTLLLVEQGLSTAGVAERVGIAESTVTQHLAAARRKYGVRTSAQAAARARQARDLW